MSTPETLPTEDIERLRREAIILKSAQILALCSDKHKGSDLLEDLREMCMEHGAKIVQSVYREAVA